jgi:excisionase family DNA binding protein
MQEGTEMSEEQTELRFLTLAEAAIILQVSKRTILRMIQKKEVPALKVGGQWRLRESQLRRWAEEKENVVAAFE